MEEEEPHSVAAEDPSTLLQVYITSLQYKTQFDLSWPTRMSVRASTIDMHLIIFC